MTLTKNFAITSMITSMIIPMTHLAMSMMIITIATARAYRRSFACLNFQSQQAERSC
jgi:hypothetical protein